MDGVTKKATVLCGCQPCALEGTVKGVNRRLADLLRSRMDWDIMANLP